MAVKKEGVTYDEIVRSVRAGNFAPVYYLMGEEAYYIDKVSEFIVDTALKEEEKDFNLTVCYGTDVTADEVINAAKRFPMMAERQVDSNKTPVFCISTASFFLLSKTPCLWQKISTVEVCGCSR